MSFQDPHLSDQELLFAADGELPPARAAHLLECWSCRVRKKDFDDAILDYVRLHQASLDPLIPPRSGPRALLKAQLAEMASVPQPPWNRWFYVPALKHAAVVLLLAVGVIFGYRHWNQFVAPRAFRTVPVSFPEPSLTPGAVATVDRAQVCSSVRPKNRSVSPSVRRRVFEEYGLSTAEPRAYEVDYLITPALGGSDDIRNLWPQSYTAAVWNARVKDALEDRLRDLVCDGSLDLASAQHEISTDWIGAYKKYFHTDRPMGSLP